MSANASEQFRDWLREEKDPTHMLLHGKETWMGECGSLAPAQELEHSEKLKMYEECMEEKIASYLAEVRRIFDIDAPALQGSQKQRLWAEKIRCEKLDKVSIFSKESKEEKEKNRKEKRLAMVNKLDAINASYWIENRNKDWKDFV